jgi:rubrerythrin
MTEFSTPFYGKVSDRKLTHSELVRGIRISIADEYEAIQVYTQLAESIDNELARAVLFDIANEERVHAGEFMRLLKELAPDEEGFYQDGAAEVEDMISRVGTGNAAATSSPSASAPGAQVTDGAESTIGSLKK